MTDMPRRLFALLSLLAVSADGARAENTTAPQVALPAEVAAYVDRRLGCNHWQGEDAYDAERGRDIAAAIRQLKCARIDRDEARLRQRYVRSPHVLKALNAARFTEG